MKNFLLVFRELANGPQTDHAEDQNTMQQWMEWFGKIGEAGNLVDHGNPLEYSGKVVKPDNVVTNGPYTEIKELVGGYSVIQADSYESAVEIAKGCPILKVGGNVEIREIAKM